MSELNITVKDVLKVLEFHDLLGNEKAVIDTVLQIGDANGNEHTLYWCNAKNTHRLRQFSCGTYIVPKSISKEEMNSSCNYILVEKPREAFKIVLQTFLTGPPEAPEIAQAAMIHASVKIDSTCSIGHFTVIEQNCKIGANVKIGSNTVIKAGTVIQDGVSIGSNCTIGGVGFGYEKNTDGSYEMIPHIGNVFISKYVEIGNNTCIDRAVIGSTFIGENVKVDNLVHIAHGAHIGENSLIIANAMIAGSCKVGKNVWVAPSSSIKNGLEVEDDVLIGMGAVVIKSASRGQVIVGNPGKALHKDKAE